MIIHGNIHGIISHIFRNKHISLFSLVLKKYDTDANINTDTETIFYYTYKWEVSKK